MNKLLLPLVIGILIISIPAFAQNYIMIGWNDLGMHCSNKDFSQIVILPPYNNIRAQVIQVGDALNPPQIVTTDFNITYEIPGNTFSVGKTNFWDYEDQLFGVNLPPDTGLTGAGLTGDMAIHENYFFVDGVPITPFLDNDLVNEDPFQLGLLKLYDQSEQLLATAEPVIPVSNEINCVSSGCHSSEQDIIDEHHEGDGFDPNNTPILCANCHASNGLGAPGQPGIESLSEVIHKKHGDKTNDCYKCHPGPNTQCFRGVMKVDHNFDCQTCHGSVTQVGESISDGREPWFDEPACGDALCHGSNFAEEPGKLFRQSKGHGGLFCSACHGEPHAIVPSGEPRDNIQNIALQGYSGTLEKCSVCHGITPTAPGPHGILATTATCGDADGSGSIDISDAVYLITYIFGGGPAPDPLANGDADCSGSIDISDAVYIITYIFGGGPEPCASCP